jgi:ribonuclease HII
LPATFRAMQMAVDQLAPLKDRDFAVLLVDGSLTPDLTTAAKHTHVEAIIKGDRQVLSIAAAAIMAKYDRDQDMLALAQEYPNYQWQNNKGYGTADHQSALDAYGVTPYHRTSYRPVARRLTKENMS